MKRIAFLLPAIALSVQAADVTGSWTVTGAIGKTAVNLTCTLSHAGSQVVGSCSGSGTKMDLTAGSSEGQTVTFQYQTTSNGQAVAVVYTGALSSAAEMKGVITAGVLGSGSFTAVKK